MPIKTVHYNFVRDTGASISRTVGNDYRVGHEMLRVDAIEEELWHDKPCIGIYYSNETYVRVFNICSIVYVKDEQG